MTETSFFDRFFIRIPQWLRILLFVVLICGIVYIDTHTQKSDTPASWQVISETNSHSSGSVQSSSGVDIIRNATQARVTQILADAEVQKTLSRIIQDRPLYHQDGAVFQNREGNLPNRSDRSYYSEWTIKTPGSVDRWARRIIEGKWGELYFTDDHYDHFTQIR